LKERKLIWMGSSLEDLRSFPEDTKYEIGYALRVAQKGGKHKNTKKYKSLNGVMEIKSDYDKETYRALYAYKIDELIYVLHVFHKKSKTGSKVPREIDRLIRQRYKEAINHAKQK
jgi:phage-related protein